LLQISLAIDFPTSNYNSATGINDFGQIVGVYLPAGPAAA
jgi:hypothetical protein